MSLTLVSNRSPARLTAQQREQLRIAAAAVGRAASLLMRQRRTSLEREDLLAIGIHAVWAKLPAYDPARSTYERWAFCVAILAMMDATREHSRETLFARGLRRGARARVQLDDSAAESDFHNDTPDTDLRRLRYHIIAIAAAAVMQAHLDQQDAGTATERAHLAEDTRRILDEETARLTQEQRLHLKLRFWDEKPTDEVAAHLGASTRNLHRAWVHLQDLLRARLTARGITTTPDDLTRAADAHQLQTTGKLGDPQ